MRVGPITGETPHWLMGHEGGLADVAVHPDGQWIASTEYVKGEVRLWPMPHGKPFVGLPYAEFLNRLRALTNVRSVADQNSLTGYHIENTYFPGWENAPGW